MSSYHWYRQILGTELDCNSTYKMHIAQVGKKLN